MEIQPGMFKIGDQEDVYLSGIYDLKVVYNKEIIGDEIDGNIRCQLVYDVGNVLYRTETENIDELIDLFIRYSYDPCTDVDLDLSIKERTILASGTICPARNVLFAYKGKIFVAFGRYIFGYEDYGTETLKRVGVVEEKGESKVVRNQGDDGKFEIFPDLISNDEIYLNGPPDEERRFPRGDCYYSFMIYDQKTLVLDAFGLYW